jgi:hypothetical protein
MINPLDGIGAPAPSGDRGFNGMAVGEVRTCQFATRYDDKGKIDYKSREPMTLTRTDRPLIYDWIDVSNERLAQRDSKHRWWVDSEGEAHLLPIKEARRRLRLER